MLKKLAPILTLLLSVLLDTAVLPVFYNGRFLVPLSLIVVILSGIQLGRTQGMIYGMIAGLLLDISAGTLGMKLFPYVIIGFLIGFLLDQQPEIGRGIERRERIQRYAVRAIWIAVLLLLYEAVMLIYQYFYTAIFQWRYVGDLLLRVIIVTSLCMALYSPIHRMYFGKASAAGKSHSTREVKHF